MNKSLALHTYGTYSTIKMPPKKFRGPSPIFPPTEYWFLETLKKRGLYRKIQHKVLFLENSNSDGGKLCLSLETFLRHFLLIMMGPKIYTIWPSLAIIMSTCSIWCILTAPVIGMALTVAMLHCVKQPTAAEAARSLSAVGNGARLPPGPLQAYLEKRSAGQDNRARPGRLHVRLFFTIHANKWTMSNCGGLLLHFYIAKTIAKKKKWFYPCKPAHCQSWDSIET